MFLAIPFPAIDPVLVEIGPVAIRWYALAYIVGLVGGWLMAQVDMAGAVLPYRIARGRIATVAVNEFLFKQPVSIGDLLSFYARIERVGKTSITVHVEVFAERNPVNPEVVKVTEARITYVAIDKDGKPRQVPRAEA